MPVAVTVAAHIAVNAAAEEKDCLTFIYGGKLGLWFCFFLCSE